MRGCRAVLGATSLVGSSGRPGVPGQHVGAGGRCAPKTVRGRQELSDRVAAGHSVRADVVVQCASRSRRAGARTLLSGIAIQPAPHYLKGRRKGRSNCISMVDSTHEPSPSAVRRRSLVTLSSQLERTVSHDPPRVPSRVGGSRRIWVHAEPRSRVAHRNPGEDRQAFDRPLVLVAVVPTATCPLPLKAARRFPELVTTGTWRLPVPHTTLARSPIPDASQSRLGVGQRPTGLVG